MHGHLSHIISIIMAVLLAPAGIFFKLSNSFRYR
jgi:hypothetical protein